MQLTYASEPTPGRVNEDYLTAGFNWLVLLDGATPPEGVDSGCRHDVPWLVRHLAGHLAYGLTTVTDSSLPDLLADAIRETCADHANTCDLANPASPSATVIAYRIQAGPSAKLEYLALGDSSILLDLGDEVRHVTDDRTDRLVDHSVAGVEAARNTPGTPDRPSFWVASTVPYAAYEAITGSVPVARVRRAALLSDGGARWMDRFMLGKPSELLELLETAGPSEVIRQVREEELAETEEQRRAHRRRGKRYDDATVALVTP